jgi:hypothetical protein
VLVYRAGCHGLRTQGGVGVTLGGGHDRAFHEDVPGAGESSWVTLSGQLRAGCFPGGGGSPWTLAGTHLQQMLTKVHVSNSLLLAMDARKLIGQTQGILMERFRVDAEGAFAILRRYSQDNNRKLRDVVMELINTRKLPN